MRRLRPTLRLTLCLRSSTIFGALASPFSILQTSSSGRSWMMIDTKVRFFRKLPLHVGFFVRAIQSQKTPYSQVSVYAPVIRFIVYHESPLLLEFLDYQRRVQYSSPNSARALAILNRLSIHCNTLVSVHRVYQVPIPTLSLLLRRRKFGSTIQLLDCIFRHFVASAKWSARLIGSF